MQVKLYTSLLLVLSTSSCGGSLSTSSPIPDGDYVLAAATCQTGTLTEAGAEFNAAIEAVALFQRATVSDDGTSLAVGTFRNGETADDYCYVQTSGTLTYSGATVTYEYGDAVWAPTGLGSDGTGGCPADIEGATVSYDFLVGDDGNVATFALSDDDPNYLSSYCSSGKVGRVFEDED